MTIQIKHSFISTKGDGTDATLVQPSAWNAAHAFTLATGNLVGRLSAGAGNAEEIPISAFMAGLLAATDVNALAGMIGLFSTGDCKISINPTTSAGWISYQGTGTIGNAVSGASIRANADTLNLFTAIYNAISDGYCSVSGGRTGNALNDFNAGKTIVTPWFSGRAIIGAGGGGSLTTRTVGQWGGEENHTTTVGEMPPHYHTVSIYDPAHNHSCNAEISNQSSTTGGGSFAIPAHAGVATINSNYTGVRCNSGNGLDTTNSAGSGAAHNNMQPYIPMWIHVKL